MLDIVTLVTLSMGYMGQLIWDTRQNSAWDVGQCVLGHKILRDRHVFENHGTLDNIFVYGTLMIIHEKVVSFAYPSVLEPIKT